MEPQQVILKWVEAFNNKDAEALGNLYAEDAINHQVTNDPLVGRDAIEDMFRTEFGQAEMVCLVENIFQDKEWAMLEWKDPLGLRGCGFFKVQHDKIVFQRGYWDKLTFLRMHGLPVPKD